jgi:putative heme iron utilization protein
MDKDRNINMLIELSIDTYSYNMAMKRVMLSLPEEMVKVLDKERKEKYLESIPETVRVIL